MSSAHTTGCTAWCLARCPSCCIPRIRAVQRIFQNTICKPGGFCKRSLSGKLWLQLATQCLIKLVKRHIVAGFAMLEAFSSLWAMVFYNLFGPVASLIGSGIINSVGVIILICLVRFCSALLGAWAAWNRRVGRTRAYWIMVPVNLILSFPVVLPIVYCACDCQYDHGTPRDVGQCAALESYQVMLRPEDRQCLTPTVPPTPSPTSPILGTRLGARDDLPETASDLGGGPHIAQTLGEDLRKLMEAFVITDAGILYTSTDPLKVDLDGLCRQPETLTGAEAMALRIGLRTLHCTLSGLLFLNDTVVTRMLRPLADCKSNATCNVVEWTLTAGDTGGSIVHSVCGLKETALPHLETPALELAATCSLERSATGINFCSPEPPEQEECIPLTIYAKKKAPLPDPDYLNPRLWTYCFMINAFTLVLFMGLTVMALPMIIVIYKFVEDGCGDAFATATQFQVDFTASQGLEEEDDDFAVGTWISLQERRANSRRMSGQTGGTSASGARSYDTRDRGTFLSAASDFEYQRPNSGSFSVDPLDRGATGMSYGVGSEGSSSSFVNAGRAGSRGGRRARTHSPQPRGRG